jgi:hypothetical protein
MLAYLLLSGRDGAPIAEESIRRFALEPPELPIEPTERIVWKNATGSVVFLGWQAFTGFAGIRSHWAVDEQGLTAFSGHCWPQATGWDHAAGQSWATQLRRYLHGRDDTIEARGELFGQFHLIQLSALGSGLVVPDYLNAEPLYLAEDDNVVAVSNRAGLTVRAVTPEGVVPERSLMGAGWLLCAGSMLDEESGYWDAQHLPFGSHLVIDPRAGATVVEASRSPLVPPAASTYEDALERVDSELRSTMRVIAALPIPDLELALSGGKDSRLLTAIVLSEGLRDRFRFVTIGPPNRADSLAARQIATTFGLDWSLIDRSGRSPQEALDEASAHTSLVEGITSAWDAVGPTIFTGGATVSGFAGEYLRWGGLALKGTAVTSEAELLALVRRGIGLDPLGILRPEALEYYQHAMASWVNRHLGRGEDLTEIASFYMQETRVRDRAGPTQAWNARLRLSPFPTRGIVQANHGLPRSARPDHRFEIDLMRRHNVALSKLPYANSGWGEPSIAHLPDADDYRTVAPIHSAGDAARNWRLVRYADYRPMLEEFLLDPGNPIQELIQRDRLAEKIATGDANPGRTRLLWGALTAAIWMGRHEEPAKITQ